MGKAVFNQAHILQEGEKAPDFTLPVDGGEHFTLSKLQGKNVVLYFYPKDDTPGCTQESKEFGEALEAFEKAHTVIVGISKCGIKSHEKFKEKYCLPFALASDEGNQVCETYNVWTEKSMYGKKYMGIERSTFLIDKTGVIRKLWRKVKVDGHVAEVLEAVRGVN